MPLDQYTAEGHSSSPTMAAPRLPGNSRLSTRTSVQHAPKAATERYSALTTNESPVSQLNAESSLMKKKVLE
jgi:hypothetical protein